MRTLTARPADRLTVAVRAAYLELEVITDPGRDRAVAELTGPEDLLDRVREQITGGTWTLTWPDDPAGAGSGGVTIIQGGMIVTGSNFGNISAGRNIRVNGVDIGDLIARSGAKTPEPLRAVIRVPAGTTVDADVEAGSVMIRGPVAGVMARTRSADVTCSGQTGQISVTTMSGDVDADRIGPGRVKTMSGDVSLAADGALDIDTMSGDISVHALAAIMVDASSMSGDIRVTAEAGALPAVSARSMSGRVRIPPRPGTERY